MSFLFLLMNILILCENIAPGRDAGALARGLCAPWPPWPLDPGQPARISEYICSVDKSGWNTFSQKGLTSGLISVVNLIDLVKGFPTSIYLRNRLRYSGEQAL